MGAPRLEFPVPVAPIAPEPLVPVVSTPVKDMTEMEALMLWERLAVTMTLFNGEAEKARQISDPPLWTLVLCTKTQVNPPPDTLLTVVLAPDR